jgi:hypothetical protein
MMGVRVAPKGKRYIMISLGPHLIYCEKGGGLVLRSETSWRKISGVVINTAWGCYWLQFRRAQLL